MKKSILILCLLMIIGLFTPDASFAANTESSITDREINTATKQFLYGDWKIKEFIGFQNNIEGNKDNTEELLGKIVDVAMNVFSTGEFDSEYKKYAEFVWVKQYNVIDNLTGKEFTSKYKVSENVTKIKADDSIQVIQPEPEEDSNASAEIIMIDVNNERLLICLNGEYFELGKNIWTENDMNIDIYDPYVSNDGFYQVEYHNNEAEKVSEEDSIRLLMINGGFVPNPDIKIIKNNAFVPIGVVSELLGAKVDWDENTKIIDITDGATRINLTVNSNKVSINNNIKIIDTTPIILDGKIYVPVRFVAEALSADVEYISKFSKYEDWKKKTVSNVSIVTIEKANKKEKMYSVEEGLMKVKDVSVENYNDLLNFFKVCNRTFDDNCQDYDPQDIVYTNQTVGRYYVYRLNSFPDFNIYFNKYTGEIYSQCDGLPFLSINKGFINISWMYQ